MIQEHLISPDCKKVIKDNQGLVKGLKCHLDEAPLTIKDNPGVNKIITVVD